ncbi:nickel-dependent hydrogenase large subunit, partial [bacterium]|nr:nickel-dependent hydrogenase large subunit [bacterium]
AKAVALAKNFHENPYNCSETHYKEVQARLKRFVDSGRLGPFANAYWGNPSYKMSPEANLIATSHYLDALGISKTGAQMMAIFGGKNPHPQTLVVGGITSTMDMLDASRLGQYKYRLDVMKDFVERAYLPDVVMAAGFYKDEGLSGAGAGVKNYLCMGGFPLTDDWSRTLLPKGIVKGGDISKPLPFDEKKIAEDVTHSWYKGDENLYPFEGKTEPEYTGFDEKGNIKGGEKYSWGKAPNYENEPYEVGPLARFIVGYAQGHEQIKPLVDNTLKALGLPATVLFSTLGRTAARALETKLVADNVGNWINELIANIKAGDTRSWTRCDVPKSGKGRGLNEVPRGGLSHWIKIENSVISNYQAVVPSTWNSAPRNKAGKRGPYEEALVGLKVAKADQPLEIIRTIHSFDPCMACAVHVIRPGKDVKEFKVR